MSTLDYRDLPGDRLATTDKDGGRMWIIPARVRGRWKSRKTVFHIILLTIFILTPWLRWKGDPIVLLDIMERRFVFFGRIFSAHDAPYLFFVLGILGLSLIVVTALWGRVWCGWGCPQTVFIEQVFRRIERLVVGNRAQQIYCSHEPFRLKNFIRLFIKWSLFIFISLFLAHTFIAYFVSWEKLLEMMSQPPAESWTVFVIVLFFAGSILFDFAWFREQFCIIMCPYGRFQSVLMDKASKTVAYDYKRGEPRARKLTAKAERSAGDCIDCYKCVSVCPTGIDIRMGQQMECIGCTACIDACDEVMRKIKRSEGLIRYASLNDIEGKKSSIFKPRVIAYFFVISLLCVGFVLTLNQHKEFYINILRQNQKPYASSENMIINNFRVHLRNPSKNNLLVRFKVVGSSDVTMAPLNPEIQLAKGEDRHFPFFLKFSKDYWEKTKEKTIILEIVYGDQQILETLTLVGP